MIFCLAPDTCTCVTGWTGNICEIRKFFFCLTYFLFHYFDTLRTFFLAICTNLCIHGGICVCV